MQINGFYKKLSINGFYKKLDDSKKVGYNRHSEASVYVINVQTIRFAHFFVENYELLTQREVRKYGGNKREEAAK